MSAPQHTGDPWATPRAEPPRPAKPSPIPKRNTVAYEEHIDALRKAPAIECYACGFRGPTLKKHRRMAWYTFILLPGVVILGGGIIGLLLAMAWLRDTKPACAACGSTSQVLAYSGPISEEAVGRVAAATEQEQRQFKRGQTVVLASLLAVLAILVVVIVW